MKQCKLAFIWYDGPFKNFIFKLGPQVFHASWFSWQSSFYLRGPLTGHNGFPVWSSASGPEDRLEIQRFWEKQCSETWEACIYHTAWWLDNITKKLKVNLLSLQLPNRPPLLCSIANDVLTHPSSWTLYQRLPDPEITNESLLLLVSIIVNRIKFLKSKNIVYFRTEYFNINWIKVIAL